MFLVRMPDDFTPEDYGWERRPDPVGVPASNSVFKIWRRARPGHTGFEVLSTSWKDPKTGAVAAWFSPLPCPEEATLPELWAMMRDTPHTPVPAGG